MKDKLYRFFYTAPIIQVVSIPMVISLFLIFSPLLFNQSLPNFLDHGWISFILGLFVFGFCGIPMIIRQESHIPFFRSGKKAVLYGYFIVCLFWGSALLFLVFTLIKFFQ